jgi:hypothetical protein
MKGTCFQKPLEFNLRIDGESWQQGESIVGSLTVKNHGPTSVPLSAIHARLAYGELKKVRAKSQDAFKVISESKSEGTLESQKEVTIPFKFETDRNCQITDTSGSLFLVYGDGDATEKLGQLQLAVHPYWVIQEFVKTFQTDFRFVVKTQKAGKGTVEIKLVPPVSQAFATLEQVIFSFKFQGDALEMQSAFHTKKVEASAASVDLKKEKKASHHVFEAKQYLLPSGRFNHDTIVPMIREVLSAVEAKTLFK